LLFIVLLQHQYRASGLYPYPSNCHCLAVAFN
jgi:hypothetical protein